MLSTTFRSTTSRCLMTSIKPNYTRASSSLLRDRVVSLIPEKQKELKEINTKYGDKVLGPVTISQAIGGMRDVKSMLWETSLLECINKLS